MLREGERVWGGYLSICIAMIGTVFNLLTIIVVSIDYETPTPPCDPTCPVCNILGTF